jgi:DNA-binding transcriptional ArsR family regulator
MVKPVLDQEGASSEVRSVDAQVLRALSHPLRVELLEILQKHGPATATELARRSGESSGTTSWHLRQLAAVGLVVEDAGRGTKRERWWQAVHRSTRMRMADFVADPEMADALTTHMHAVVQQRYRAEAHFVSHVVDLPERWRDRTALEDDLLFLEPDEAARLTAEIDEVLERYRRPATESSEPVIVHWAAFPRDPTEASDTAHLTAVHLGNDANLTQDSASP